MTQYSKRSRSIRPDLLAEIGELGVRGITGTEIARTFERRGIADAPSVRTIQYVLRESRPPDGSGVWSLADGDRADIPVVLEVLRAVIEETQGRRTYLTRNESEWIVRVHSAASDLPAWDTYRLARRYLVMREHGEPTSALDIYLAYRGWRADQDLPYTAAIAAGWVPEPPLDIWLGLRPQDEFAAIDRVLVAAAHNDGVIEQAVEEIRKRYMDQALEEAKASLSSAESVRERATNMIRKMVESLAHWETEALSVGAEERRSVKADGLALLLGTGKVTQEQAESLVIDLEALHQRASDEIFSLIRDLLPQQVRHMLDEARAKEMAGRDQTVSKEVPDVQAR